MKIESIGNQEADMSELQTVKEEFESNHADYEARDITKFDWKNRWLNGEEYFHILTNADLYANAFSFSKYPPKTHPSSTYSNPESKYQDFISNTQ